MELSSFNAGGIEVRAPAVAVAEAAHRCSDLKLQSVCSTAAAVVAAVGFVMLVVALVAVIPYCCVALSCIAIIISSLVGVLGIPMSLAIACIGPDGFDIGCAVANWKALLMVESRIAEGDVVNIDEEKLRAFKEDLDKIIAENPDVSAVVQHLAPIVETIDRQQLKLSTLSDSDDREAVAHSIADLEEMYDNERTIYRADEEVGRALLKIRRLLEQKDAKASDVVRALLFVRFLLDMPVPSSPKSVEDLMRLSGATERLDGALLLFGIVVSRADGFEEPGAFDEALGRQPSSRGGYRPI
jgi:hypothetical protein